MVMTRGKERESPKEETRVDQIIYIYIYIYKGKYPHLPLLLSVVQYM